MIDKFAIHQIGWLVNHSVYIPLPRARDTMIISLPSLTFAILFYLSPAHDAFDIADPRSKQDACHISTWYMA